MSDPTLPELMRRLDDITKSMDRLVSNLEVSYVRRDVYEVAHNALRREVTGQYETLRREVNAKGREYEGDIQELKTARERDAAYRRQIMAGAAVGVILMLISLAFSASNFIARAAG